MPAGKLIKFGVWENSQFVGAVIYGRGANNNASKYFQLPVTELCELCRIALTKHVTPVSRIMKICLSLLKKQCPKIRLIFSYADETNQGHQGKIYHADNWTYLGKRTSKGGHVEYYGNLIHYRSVNAKYKSKKNIPTSVVENMKNPGEQVKHLFVKLIDPTLKNRFRARSETNDTSGDQSEKDGATPIRALQN